jgi:hypothetical protein
MRIGSTTAMSLYPLPGYDPLSEYTVDPDEYDDEDLGCENCEHIQIAHYDGGCQVCDEVGQSCSGYAEP